MPYLPDWNDLPQSVRTGLVQEATVYCEPGSEGDAAVAIYEHLRVNLDEARRLERQKRAYADLFETPSPDATPPSEEASEPVAGRANAGPYSVAYEGGNLVEILTADEGGEDHPDDVGPDVVVALAKEVVRLHALLARPDFQRRVAPWMQVTFGETISNDKAERNHRFLEEALELVQACGCTRQEAHMLVEYVFDRPLGEIGQEIGGVCVTLAALCLAQRRDLHAEGDRELRRIWGKVEALRAKQASRPKASPLAAEMPIPAAIAPFVTALAATRYDGDSRVVWATGTDAPDITLGHLRGLVGRYAGPHWAA